MDASLRKNLYGKSLIEHPTILVTMEAHKEVFPEMGQLCCFIAV